MTARSEVFLVGVEIRDKTMGNNKYEETPMPQMADVKLYANKQKGILLLTDNKFWKRLWFQISNPFRYVFTGKIRY